MRDRITGLGAEVTAGTPADLVRTKAEDGKPFGANDRERQIRPD